MSLSSHQLLNISPLDGRYKNKTLDLTHHFSEYGYTRWRLIVEIDYLIFIIKLLKQNDLLPINIKELLNKQTYFNPDELINIYNNFNLQECEKIKEFEKETNHDVKSIEYYIKYKINTEYPSYYKSFIPFIHFALTSQDANNPAITLSTKYYINNTYTPNIKKLINLLSNLSNKWMDIIMMARTHGQPAIPTSLGKEFKVFEYRLTKQLNILNNIKFYTKFGGAVGNLNAHYASYPDINWINELNKHILENYDVERDEYTTQIDNYENLAIIFDTLRRINTILIDMVKDIWSYISIDYLTQTYNKNETGSSTMPQKINPINFENAEGNLLLSNTLLDFMSNKLPVSRLQRDLTDSTVVRNIGSSFGYIEVAFDSINKGLNKINPNTEKINYDLNNNYSVLMECVQTILRKEGIDNAYEQIKELSRGQQINTRNDYINLINKLNIDKTVKDKLINYTPFNYIGIIKQLNSFYSNNDDV